ncbi:MAG: hypothetical protein RLY87_37 [Chloroflexota bacterium]|jgi:hypothetical protein
MNATIEQLTRGQYVDTASTPLHIPPYRIGQTLVRATSLLGFVAQVGRGALALALALTLLGTTTPGHWYVVIPVLYFVVSIFATRAPRLQGVTQTALDCLFYAFFVNLTGGIASPYLLGMVALIPLAMIADGLRGSVMAACMNLLVVLVAAGFALPAVAPALPTALLAVFLTGVVCGWTSVMSERMLRYLCTGVQSESRMEPVHATPNVHAVWAGDIEQLLKITDPHQLLRAAKQYACTVANSPVDIQVGTMRMGGVGPDATRMVCDAAQKRAILTIHLPPAQIPAHVLAQLRLIGHIVARHWDVPIQTVEATDVTPTTPMLATASTWETLDIPGLEDAVPVIEETAAPTTPLQSVVLTAILPEPGEVHPRRRTRANADQSQLDLWI